MGREFILHFQRFTLSPRGRGEGEGAYSSFFTASPLEGEG